MLLVFRSLGLGQNKATREPQILVHVSTYQSPMLGTYV